MMRRPARDCQAAGREADSGTMKKFLAVLGGLLVLLLAGAASGRAADLDAIQGKWTIKKTSDRGTFTQTLEFKKNKFTFKMAGEDGKSVLYAEGEVKVEQIGPFKSLRLFNMKAGKTADEAESVDEDRTVIFRVDDDGLVVVANLDKERSEKPSLDVYKKQ